MTVLCFEREHTEPTNSSKITPEYTYEMRLIIVDNQTIQTMCNSHLATTMFFPLRL